MADSKIDSLDVGALERAVNDSATRVSAIWLSFVAFSAYLAAAGSNISHRQIFLEEPIKLPTINIDLPLIGSAILLPLLFVIFHVYLLLQVVLLARTADAYNVAIENAVAEGEERTRIRQRLANTLFAQIFAGSPREREGLLGALLRAMSWITLAIAPILVLVLFEFKFLPYHSHAVTWTHRAAIVLDIVAVLTLWDAAIDASRDIAWRSLVRRRLVAGCAALLVLASLLLATFPGEPQRSVTRLFGDADADGCETPPFTAALFPANFDRVHLPAQGFVDDDKLGRIARATAARGRSAYEGERTRSFQGRDLACAILTSADLRRADFKEANLFRAWLDDAELQGASFERAKMQNARLQFAQLQSASLQGAVLHGAVLIEAKLQGANLSGAQLQGAVMGRVQLQAAFLDDAALHGAELDSATLQGASLVHARLIATDLSGAQLQGAHLNEAELQGASFAGSELAFASFESANLWRTRAKNCSQARFGVSPSFGAYFKIPTAKGINTVQATPDATAALISGATGALSELRRKDLQSTMRQRLITEISPNEIAAMEKGWGECVDTRPAYQAEPEFDRKHAEYLRNLACDRPEDRKPVAEGLVAIWLIDRAGRPNFRIRLAKGLLGLDGRDCAATKELDERTKERLRAALVVWETDLPKN